jgi:hypothetical protein
MLSEIILILWRVNFSTGLIYRHSASFPAPGVPSFCSDALKRGLM